MKKEYILNYLKNHKQEFKKKYGIEEIGLFGSYARDEAKDSSDIDIFIKMKPNFEKLMSFKYQIEDRFKTKVDIVRLRKRMNQALKRRILEEGIYV